MGATPKKAKYEKFATVRPISDYISETTKIDAWRVVQFWSC